MNSENKLSAEFPFESKYVQVHGHQIHYIEKGQGPVFLFLHGNPTWSYLWRNVIPPIAEHGRCVALDLMGFGKSDRPRIGYRFLDHYRYVTGFIETLQLKDIILVGHDWGGVLGFYYSLNNQENIKGIAFMETFPFTFSWDEFPRDFKLGFKLFRTPGIGHFLIMVMNVFVNKILPSAVYRELSEEIHANYKACFPTIRSRYPVYVWPNELPIEGRYNKTFQIIQKIEDALPQFKMPMLLITAEPGGVIRKYRLDWLRKRIHQLTVKSIGPGIHFLQEDNPLGIAEAILQWSQEQTFLA